MSLLNKAKTVSDEINPSIILRHHFPNDIFLHHLMSILRYPEIIGAEQRTNVKAAFTN